MKLLWVAPVALVLASACTSAPQPAPTQVADASGKKICRSEKVLGRMVPVEICRTQAEWDATNAKDKEMVRDAGRSVQSNAGTFKTQQFKE